MTWIIQLLLLTNNTVKESMRSVITLNNLEKRKEINPVKNHLNSNDLKPFAQERCTIDNTTDLNNNFHNQKIERCCLDHEAIAVCTYSSGRTWLVCNYHDQHEAFRDSRTSRTRLSQ